MFRGFQQEFPRQHRALAPYWVYKPGRAQEHAFLSLLHRKNMLGLFPSWGASLHPCAFEGVLLERSDQHGFCVCCRERQRVVSDRAFYCCLCFSSGLMVMG